MIQIYTNLDVADNTGARRIRCMQVMGGTRRRYAHLGDIITATVKEALPNSNVKKGDVVKAVVVRTRQDTQRPDGTVIRFDSNAAVLINPNKEPQGCLLYTSDAADELLCVALGGRRIMKKTKFQHLTQQTHNNQNHGQDLSTTKHTIHISNDIISTSHMHV